MSDINLPGHYTLYELNNSYAEAFNKMEIDENGEVIGAEHLAFLREERDQKIQNLAHMYLRWEAEQAAVKKEKDRIESIRKRLSSKMEWAIREISNYVPEGTKIGRISWRKSTSLEIDSNYVQYIPEEYVIQELKPVKGLIKLAIEKGEIIPGCEIIENQNIQIK